MADSVASFFVIRVLERDAVVRPQHFQDGAGQIKETACRDHPRRLLLPNKGRGCAYHSFTTFSSPNSRLNRGAPGG